VLRHDIIFSFLLLRRNPPLFTVGFFLKRGPGTRQVGSQTPAAHEARGPQPNMHYYY
jgi:hypothetical protein